MPLPWQRGHHSWSVPVVSETTGSSRRKGFENAEDRAITIQQLCDLRTFLQRLCKTGMLPFDWFSINMYHITSEVIKKVIPFIDKRNGPHWYSWVEFVALEKQPAKVMVSHSWAGCFRDFAASIDRLVDDKGLSLSTPIWVCTFVNNQFYDNFGVDLASCPFIKAVNCADGTVFILDKDRQQSALSRCWTGLELYHTISVGKELDIYTSLGRIGSPAASSGPLCEAMKRWDIRKTKATEEAYRRQILNYIAGEDQFKGLQRDEDKNVPLLIDGRPLLQDDEEPCVYDARLLSTHAEKFEDLNMAVRSEVVSNIGRSRVPTKYLKIDKPEEHAISLEQLRTFARKLQVTFAQGLSLQHVLEKVILPATITADGTCSYVERLGTGPGVPSYYVHLSTFNSMFQDSMDSIECFADAMHLADSTMFYWELFALNHHETKNDSSWNHRGESFEHFVTFKALAQCKGLLVTIMDEGEGIGRIWRMVKMEWAAMLAKNVYLATGQAALACSHPFPDGTRVYGCFSASLAKQFACLRLEEGTADSLSDKNWILDTIARDARDEHERKRCFDAFHSRIRRWVAGVIVRAEAKGGNRTQVLAALNTCGLAVNDDCMKGTYGETAAHIAAAVRGSEGLKILLTLLEAGMDANARDSIGETPLHYAAISGNADAVKMLLQFRANPLCSSIYDETPRMVYNLNPAAFTLRSDISSEPGLTSSHMQSNFIRTLLQDAEETCWRESQKNQTILNGNTSDLDIQEEFKSCIPSHPVDTKLS